jgi:putative endonuclease
MTITNRRALGNLGEQAVADYLKKRGFNILAFNFTSKFGEIDIIAQQDNLIVCVEVKTRKDLYFPLSQVITPSKQRKIVTTAKWYLMEHKLTDVAVRFDVALVHFGSASAQIEYLESAFYGK